MPPPGSSMMMIVWMLSLCILTLPVTATPTITRMPAMKMSVARRNLAAVSTGPGTAVLAGGCVADARNPAVPINFDCGQASSLIEIINSTGAVISTSQLSTARSWVSGCSPEPGVAVFAGGGVSGALPHSTVGDTFEVSSKKLTTKPDALVEGRWGIATATVGSACYFAGGKVTIEGYKNAYTTSAIDKFSMSSGWVPAGYNLSRGRESAVAVGIGKSLGVISGWQKYPKFSGKYFGCPNVDLFQSPSMPGGDPASVGTLSPEYDKGVVTIGGYAWIAESAVMYKMDAEGKVSAVDDLPLELAGSQQKGAIPAALVPNNGVAVGSSACYYGLPDWSTNGGVYCYDTVTANWFYANATVPHVGGAITSMGNTIVVAGGYIPGSAPVQANDVIDVFVVSS